MNEGRIVEYIEQGKFVCTLCLQDKGNKLHLLTPYNREVNLSSKRAILVSDASVDTQRSREDLLERLKEIDRKREQLKTKVDVRELWELIRDESESFDHKYLAHLCFGEDAADDHLSALVRALFEDRLYFRLKDSQFLPNSEDRVDKISRQREEEAQREELLNQGGAWLRRLQQGKAGDEPACKGEVLKLLKDLALYGSDAPSFKYGKELLQKADILDVRQARRLLIQIGEWDEDENLDLLRLGIPTEFTREEMEESGRIAERGFEWDGREDLRDLNVVTIDGPMTRDFDDAISLDASGEVLKLGVHIADVAAVVSPDSCVDKVAMGRASSLYLPRRQVPMIPPLLSQDSLSLKGGCDRPAISLLSRFDREGNLLDYRFVPSVVRVRKNLTYEHVNGALDAAGSMDELYRFCKRLQQKRIEQGALNLSLPELEVRFGLDASLSLELVPQDTPSRMIVAELMILYNWLAAKFCLEHGVSILYRTQAEPSERLSLNEDGYLYYVFQQRRKLNPLLIDTQVKPHSGLGLDAYTHTTSPIRRYLDLVMQRQMGSFLLGKALVYDDKALEEIRISVEPVIKDLMRIKRNRVRYWFLKYLRRHREKRYDALVLYELKNRYRILLTDFLMVGEIKRELNVSLNPAERILVEVKKANPWEDALELEHVRQGQ